MSFKEWLKEGTFNHGEISIYYDPENGNECKISKQGRGYYVDCDDWDFTAKNKTELKKLIKKYKFTHDAGEKF